MAITSTELVNRVLSYYNDRAHWTYCHGSTGYVVGAADNKAKNLYEYYLRVGHNSTNIPYATWLANHKGKRCCDCNNFINLLVFGFGCKCFWGPNAFCKMEQLKTPIPGAIAWKDGHMGVCISVDAQGNGTYVHMPYYNRTLEKFTDNEDQWHPKSYWKGYCKLPSTYVTYTQTTPVVATPKAIIATVNGKYKEGFTLSAKDFTIKITMSDGSILTNPPGWAATPLTLTQANNTITVVYKNISTKINVPAEMTTKIPTSYKVHVGGYSLRASADKLLAQLKTLGYKGYVVQVNKLFKVQVGLYKNKNNAINIYNALTTKGFNCTIIEVY